MATHIALRRNFDGLRKLGGSAILLALLSCGGGGDQRLPPTYYEIQVKPAPVTVAAGASVDFSADVVWFNVPVGAGTLVYVAVDWSPADAHSGNFTAQSQTGIHAKATYVAPSLPGVYHVTAYSNLDAAVRTDVTVQVTP